jgi:NDP-sugar pyrophosphorylase family protein
VIFAGGASKRFGQPPLNKALAAPCRRSLIDLQIEYAYKAGFGRMTILTGFMADEVEEHVRRVYPTLSRNIVFHRHEWNPLVRPYGTGRALWKAVKDGAVDPSKPVLTLFTDDFYASTTYVHRLVRAYQRFREKEKLLGVVLVHPGVALPYGVYQRGRFTEKPELPLLVSAGMYLLTPLALRLLQEGLTEEEYYKSDSEIAFEAVVLERYSGTYTVLAEVMPKGSWLAVNDWKAAEQLCSFMKTTDWFSGWLTEEEEEVA